MGLEGSLPYSQQPAKFPQPQPDEWSPGRTTHLCRLHTDIIFPNMPSNRSLKRESSVIHCFWGPKIVNSTSGKPWIKIWTTDRQSDCVVNTEINIYIKF
jgi:hypothetical protein